MNRTEVNPVKPEKHRKVDHHHHHHHHWHNSPFSDKAIFRSFCQLSLFLTAFLQFLSPNFLASSITPSSHLSFGLPLCLLPSTTATRTLLVGLCSSIRITWPAHFNRLILMYVTVSLSLYNVHNSLFYFILHSPSKNSFQNFRKVDHSALKNTLSSLQRKIDL